MRLLRRLARTAQLDVPLPPEAALTRLAAEFRGVEGPLLDGHLPTMPLGQELVGAVRGHTFVLRRAVRHPLVRNLHAVARGTVEPAGGGGSRLAFTFLPAMLDSPPLWPLALLSLGGVAVALLDGRPSILGLVVLMWLVPAGLVLASQPLLASEVRQVLAYLEARLR